MFLDKPYSIIAERFGEGVSLSSARDGDQRRTMFWRAVKCKGHLLRHPYSENFRVAEWYGNAMKLSRALLHVIKQLFLDVGQTECLIRPTFILRP